MNDLIRTHEDLLRSIDHLFADEKGRWDRFFANLPAIHPLSTTLPDEHLVEFLASLRERPGRALDLGCGNGRNAVYLAKKGFQVDAVDISESAIAAAEILAQESGRKLRFSVSSLFDLPNRPDYYDLIYDFGCLHHIHPHRRPQYLDFVRQNLKNGGSFILGCFNEKMGTAKTDMEILRQRDMEGGLNFSEARLQNMFSPAFHLVSLREMQNKNNPESGVGWEHMRVSIWTKASP